MISGLPEVQMRHKNKSKESNVKGDFVEAGNQNKGKAIICSFRNKVIALGNCDIFIQDLC